MSLKNNLQNYKEIVCKVKRKIKQLTNLLELQRKNYKTVGFTREWAGENFLELGNFLMPSPRLQAVLHRQEKHKLYIWCVHL